MPTQPGWTIPLEDGLVMRGGVLEDADALSEYNADVHNTEPADGYDGPAFWIGEWTRDLLTKPHPRMKLDDIIVVEEETTRKIVSSTVYFDQTWSYCGIPVPVGRPEIVSTHPDYRNRGLVRKQFKLMRQWGDERGHLVQGITGIPYYYRQFGYEMALEMPRTRHINIADISKWKEGEAPSVTLRPAARTDMPFIMKCHDKAKSRALFCPELTQAELEYQFFDRDSRSAVHDQPWIVQDSSGSAIGFAALKAIVPLREANLYALEFSRRGMFRTHTAAFLKSLKQMLEQLPGPDEKSLQTLNLFLHAGNPAQSFIGREFRAGGRPYCWYIRTPDLPRLLMLVAPELEKRIVGTEFDGLTGEKVISFYRTGLSLQFDNGRLSRVEPVQMPDRQKTLVNMPDLTFLQMLFGRKSFGEVAEMFADASASSDEAALLVDTLFPKRSSEMTFALA